MVGFFTSKTFKVWLVILNVVQTVKSVDDDLPQCNLIRDVLFINALKIKVTNVSRYFCVYYTYNDTFAATLRDKVLNDDENDGLESQDSDIKCGLHLNTTEKYYVFFNSTSNETKLNSSYYVNQNNSVTMRDIANGSIISLPRILHKMNSTVFFKETITYDRVFNSSQSYEQEILFSLNSKLYVKTLELISSKSDLKLNLNLSKASSSTQDDDIVFLPITGHLNPDTVFLPITDHLNPYTIIIFFAALDEEKIKYATVKRNICSQGNFISADDNKNATILNKSLFSTEVVYFYCADYNTYFTVLGNDTCPENPKHTLNISFVHGNYKMVITTFYSTWRTSVCYKIVDLSNFSDLRVFMMYFYLISKNFLFSFFFSKLLRKK